VKKERGKKKCLILTNPAEKKEHAPGSGRGREGPSTMVDADVGEEGKGRGGESLPFPYFRDLERKQAPGSATEKKKGGKKGRGRPKNRGELVVFSNARPEKERGVTPLHPKREEGEAATL